jgi:menaquinone-dependent protoporphyrinogen IX oxidase
MRIAIIYYSSTGNTETIAQLLAEARLPSKYYENSGVL